MSSCPSIPTLTSNTVQSQSSQENNIVTVKKNTLKPPDPSPRTSLKEEPKPNQPETRPLAETSKKPEPNPPQSDLQDTRQFIEDINKQDRADLQERVAALGRKNGELKTTNGRLGLGYLLAAIELLRLREEQERRVLEQASQPQEGQAGESQEGQSLRREVEGLRLENERQRKEIDVLLSELSNLRDHGSLSHKCISALTQTKTGPKTLLIN
jgi:predicted RNase H-like nuclease (RuvC/YqgF family)